MQWNIHLEKLCAAVQFIFSHDIEVVCPFCEHRFMYNQNGREIIFYEYRDKETGKYYIDTVCPKCNEKMIVLEHE